MTPKLQQLIAAQEALTEKLTAIKCMIDCQQQIDLAPKQDYMKHYEVGQMLNEYKDLQDSSEAEYTAAGRAETKAMLSVKMLSRPEYLHNEGKRPDTSITPRNYAIEHNINHSNGATC